MSDDASTATDRGLIESVWKEARDLVKRLEGSSVQRFAVQAGDYKIEIERGVPAPAGPAAGAAGAPADAGRQLSGTMAATVGPGPGMSPGGRTASGVFTLGAQEADNRVPVLAPLVGTFYRSSQPGADAFVDVGDVVEPGQTVCIVEAMKLMNEVSAAEGGRVAEILVENGDPVEFDQVLMYLEPVEE